MPVYDETLYFHELELLMGELRQIAIRMAQLHYLDAHGVPEGSVIFSNTTRLHTLKSGEAKSYHYTNVFLYIDGKKYYIHKKRDYPSGSELHGRRAALYEPENEDARLLLCERLLLRRIVRQELKDLRKNSRRHCNLLNGSKCKALPRLEYDELLAQTFESFQESGEKLKVIAALDKTLGIEYGPIIGTREEELRYCSFFNEIYNDSGERVRSKNELIATQCAHACGLSYELEPFYPESSKRADLLIYQGTQKIYLEILGRMDDPTYHSNFKEKQELARAHHLPFVAINMTDYPDGTGKIRTRLYYDKLKRIFQRISLGILPSNVVTPY